jgi:hypothetical protein
MLRHCPTPKRPSRWAPHWAHDEYAVLKKEMRISVKGAEAIKDLRASMDSRAESSDRELIINVDGSYTNKTVIRELPPRTTLIGRIRKDAKLYSVPVDDKCVHRGRKRYYGELLPTPEKTRQSDDISWTEDQVHSGGKIPDRWRARHEPAYRSAASLQAEQEDKVTVQKSCLSDLHGYFVITREDFTMVFMAVADRGKF